MSEPWFIAALVWFLVLQAWLHATHYEDPKCETWLRFALAAFWPYGLALAVSRWALRRILEEQQ